MLVQLSEILRPDTKALTDLWAADGFVGATYGSADADLHLCHSWVAFYMFMGT